MRVFRKSTICVNITQAAYLFPHIFCSETVKMVKALHQPAIIGVIYLIANIAYYECTFMAV